MSPANSAQTTDSLAVSDEHVALAEAVRGWAARHVPPSVLRSYLETPADAMPPFWDALASQGWLGIHVAEDAGGDGYGLAEVAIVLEELGRAGAPGPYLPTVIAWAVLDRVGVDALRS